MPLCLCQFGRDRGTAKVVPTVLNDHVIIEVEVSQGNGHHEDNHEACSRQSSVRSCSHVTSQRTQADDDHARKRRDSVAWLGRLHESERIRPEFYGATPPKQPYERIVHRLTQSERCLAVIMLGRPGLPVQKQLLKRY